MFNKKNGQGFLPPGFGSSGNNNSKWYTMPVPGKYRSRLAMPITFAYARWWEDEEGKWHCTYYRIGEEPKNASFKKSIKPCFITKVYDYENNVALGYSCDKITIQEAIHSIMEEEGIHITECDMTVRKTGTGKDKTQYSVTTDTPTPVSPEVQKALDEFYFDVEKLFKGVDPFTPESGDMPF